MGRRRPSLIRAREREHDAPHAPHISLREGRGAEEGVRAAGLGDAALGHGGGGGVGGVGREGEGEEGDVA